jgi:signal transduction histidine kinase
MPKSPDHPEASELSRQLLKAQEEERRRISRELHDETGQALMVLRFQLEMLGAESPNESAKAKIQESLDLLDRTIEGLRRTIARLSPRVIEELGLIAGMRREAQLVSRHSDIKIDLDIPEEMHSLDHDLQVALYRTTQEALHNVVKHSRAKHCSVKLTCKAGRVTLLVNDDGVGFSPRKAEERGFGLTGMRERAAALGGLMKVLSQRDKGTRIRILFPASRRAKQNHGAANGTAVRVTAA